MNRVARTALAVLLGGAAFVGVAGTSAAIGAPLAALLVVVAVWLEIGRAHV